LFSRWKLDVQQAAKVFAAKVDIAEERVLNSGSESCCMACLQTAASFRRAAHPLVHDTLLIASLQFSVCNSLWAYMEWLKSACGKQQIG
jgi:hypothetical protein